MGERRRLLLMRHAKAEQHAETDHARPLSDRGWRDAHQAGLLLAERGDVPGIVLVSTAQRTRDTWTAVSRVLDGAPQVWFDRALYDAGPKAVVELLAAVEEPAGTVLVIGHNPTVSVVAGALSDGQAETSLETAVADGLATAGLASFDVPVPWHDVNARTLRVTHVDRPRG